jgi:NADH-quinone oxidoreductase subunit F
VDLKLLDATPTEEEREAVDALLGRPASGWEGGERDERRDPHTASGGHEARGRRHLLLPALQAVQSAVGWISEGALNYICTRLTVPPADAYGVVTFYALLSTVPRPRRVLHVCDDIACRCKGADRLCQELERTVGPAFQHGPDGDHVEIPEDGAVWLRSPCLGLCDQAPAGFLQVAGKEPIERLFGDLDAAKAAGLLKGDLSSSAAPHPRLPQAGDPSLRLLRRVDVADPASLDQYRSLGGYAALRAAIAMGPEAVIREVTDAKLLGRGGAAFPTGRKWDAVARQPVRPHYLICNADESEPGTFKDRVIMEGDPFSLIEAMTIAAFATGCEQGFIYIRGEYPLAAERLQGAIDAARDRGFLGDDIMEAGFAFDIEIRRGGGAYICGEETAIFNSIEGFRGEPRNKPPSRCRPGCSASPPSSTTSRPWSTWWRSYASGARRTPGSAPRGPRGRGCSASPAMWSGRGCTRCPSAPRCGRYSRWPAGCRLDGRSRRFSSAARPAGSSGRTSWTSRSLSRARGRRRPPWAPASSWSSTTPWT